MLFLKGEVERHCQHIIQLELDDVLAVMLFLKGEVERHCQHIIQLEGEVKRGENLKEELERKHQDETRALSEQAAKQSSEARAVHRKQQQSLTGLNRLLEEAKMELEGWRSGQIRMAAGGPACSPRAPTRGPGASFNARCGFSVGVGAAAVAVRAGGCLSPGGQR